MDKHITDIDLSLDSEKLTHFNLQRRHLLQALVALGLSSPLASNLIHASSKNLIQKKIPSSGELLPVIGMGTSRTFDALYDDDLLNKLQLVMQSFFDNQGALIDSSPMYKTSEEVTGLLLKKAHNSQKLFAATKVWTYGKQSGIEQMQASRELWGIKRFDLMQIHNLRDWKVHYSTLRTMKKEGKIRYIGVTTSHGRFHDELEEVLKNNHFDFLQLSYNISNRDVERRLLPIAQDKGIAVIANRPFQRGDLFQQVRGKKLPDWATDLGISSWGQYFLKFVISHPAITCAIPATTKVKHMLDNMGAQFGVLPEQTQRKEMIKYLA
ncbi:MAG: aldo/keto reductase [Gammaproteobacteria bacterium]|nr:aldo/keto reductase [Gammaproteobacteria bacterium]